jgi:hypothetical protein
MFVSVPSRAEKRSKQQHWQPGLPAMMTARVRSWWADGGVREVHDDDVDDVTGRLRCRWQWSGKWNSTEKSAKER